MASLEFLNFVGVQTQMVVVQNVSLCSNVSPALFICSLFGVEIRNFVLKVAQTFEVSSITT